MMEYRTSAGIKLYCLPDNARCNLKGKHPDDIDECPICNFDDYGRICCPDLCDKYDEVTEDE